MSTRQSISGAVGAGCIGLVIRTRTSAFPGVRDCHGAEQRRPRVPHGVSASQRLSIYLRLNDQPFPSDMFRDPVLSVSTIDDVIHAARRVTASSLVARKVVRVHVHMW